MIVFGLSGSISPANSESEIQILQAVESRQFDIAVGELLKLRAGDEASFLSKDYDYLLGRAAAANGDVGLAMATFQSVANRDSLLKPYALKHLAQIARSTGNLVLERLYLNEILTFSPDSLVAESALLRLARNSFERSNHPETISILTRTSHTPFKTGADAATLRETRGLLGQAYLRNGDVERARGIFADLLNTMPNASQPDDIALLAVQNLDLIDDGEKGNQAPQLTEAEHLRRALVYHFNREFADAKVHFDAMIANYPAGSTTAEAVFQIGRGFAQQANYVEGLKWFERVIEQYPQSTVAKDALLQAAAAYGRLGRPMEATTRYRAFIAKYPTDERLDRAYFNIVDLMRDQGEDTDALRECGKIRAIFRGKLPEAIALFTEARIFFAREEWQNAVEVLDRLKSFLELGGSTVPGGTSHAEITFLRGFAEEQLQAYPEAIETYLSISDGRSEYYGWRATDRMRALAVDTTAEQYIAQAVGRYSALLNSPEANQKGARAILRLSDNAELRGRAVEILRTVLPPLPNSRDVAARVAEKTSSEPPTVAERLLALGLYDEAVAEIGAAADISKLFSVRSETLLKAFVRGGRADLVIAFVEPVWRGVPADYPIELLPHEKLKLLFPTPFVGELVEEGSQRGVDPRLMLAIMRQESRFQPAAKSNAAARGLMQFIAPTANKVAGDLGRENFRPQELYYPPTAIAFGSQYLAGLFEVFPDQAAAVVASYNGGDDNMKRWMNRSRSSSQDRYVPEIVYSQSKDYVHKVMAGYRVYRYLYDERLLSTGVLSTDLPAVRVGE